MLKADNADLIAAGQRGVADGVVRIAIAPLPPGGTQTIDAAVMLTSPKTGAEAFATLEARAEADLWVSWQVTGWRVGDCATAFHAALSELNARLPELDRAVDTARVADKSLPGRFLFKPAAGADKETAAALRVAGTLASRRGADPFLSSRDTRWYLGQIYRDLKDYTGQPANPMICTGAREVTEFLGKYAERVEKYADGLDAQAETLRVATAGAISATWTALGAAGDAPELAGAEAIPGIIDRLMIAAGGPTIAAPQVPPTATTPAPADLLPHPGGAMAAAPTGMTADGVVISADHPLPRPNPSPDLFQVFHKARAALSANGAIAAEEARRRLTDVVGQLETYFYIANGAARAGAVRDTLYGNLDGIVAAHDKLCTCSE
ncbi:MAG TPA: hypothetical protein PLG99_04130 [Kaistiaceae bacterium]|nr:hypothetical protein [Kaistiaceae bacterium]